MNHHPHPATDDWPRPLTELLQQQQALVDRLHALAQEQSRCVESDQTDDLLRVLSQRQQIIDELSTGHLSLAEFSQRLTKDGGAAGELDRDEIRRTIEQIERQLKQVMEQDEHDQEALRESCTQVREELTAVGAGQQARQAYLRHQAMDNRFADERG